MDDKIAEFLKGHFWSAVTTFLAAFLGSLALTAGALPPDKAAIFAAVSIAVRAGFKAALQYLMAGKVGETLGAKNRV